MVGIDPVLAILLRVTGLAAAFGAGYFFGGRTPHWADDSSLEETPGARYGGYGYGYGSPGSFGPGCCFLGIWGSRGCFSLRNNGMVTAVMLAIAVGCCLLAWPLPDGAAEEYGEALLLFHKPLWAAVGAATVGYVIARVTDKGAVGPLE